MDTAVAFSGRLLRCNVIAALMANCTSASAADILLTAAETSPSIQTITAKNLLLISYAQQQALPGPNVSFVKAGSLASTYSDDIDWLDTLDALLDNPPGQWPRAHYPRHVKVTSNPRVARSLGIIAIGDAAVTLSLSQAEQRP